MCRANMLLRYGRAIIQRERPRRAPRYSHLWVTPGLPRRPGQVTMPPTYKGETAMIDLVIRGDTVVTPQGVGAHDILIADSVIAAVSEPGRIPVPEGTRIIDARGKIVMPGGVDPHVHCKWHLPAPDGSATETAPPDVVSKAAVHGGTTTIIDFTRASQGRNVRDAIEQREKDWAGHCACDY